MSEGPNYDEREQAIKLRTRFYEGALSRPELVSTLALMSEDTLLWALEGSDLYDEVLAMHRSLAEGRMVIIEDWNSRRVKVGRRYGFTHRLSSAVFRLLFWR